MLRLPASRQHRQPGLDLFDRHRREIPAIDADVAALAVAGQAAVAVAVEVERAVVRLRPDAQAVVAKRQVGPVGERDVAQALDAGPEMPGGLDASGVIVISERQVHLAVEATQVRRVIGEGEIAEVLDDVAGPDNLVVALDHDLVHLGDGGERAFRQLDDAGVAEMAVGREEDVDGWSSPWSSASSGETWLVGGMGGERAGTRTRDPMIKSHVLYRLSYALASREAV